MSILRYPTGDALLDELTEFVAARLLALHKPDMTRRASLREEWWLEEMNGRQCPVKQGWSFIYRFARDRAVEQRGRSDGAADLLSHQITELVPMMFSAVRAVADAQGANAQTDKAAAIRDDSALREILQEARMRVLDEWPDPSWDDEKRFIAEVDAALTALDTEKKVE